MTKYQILLYKIWDLGVLEKLCSKSLEIAKCQILLHKIWDLGVLGVKFGKITKCQNFWDLGFLLQLAS